jgi:hypothetical protein
MNRREVREILATHADQMWSPEASQSWTLTRNDRVQALLNLAEQLQGILVPVEPSTDFRRRLHGDLILEAQRREAEPAPSLLQEHRKGILIGAAAIGSVASVIGVIIAFVLLHLRNGRATHTAAG